MTRPAGRTRLPDEFVAHARALASGTAKPVTARDAATVVLLRDGGGAAGDAPGATSPIEVFLLRRVATMAFAAGMHVFPGGSVDPRDADTEIPVIGPSPAQWSGLLTAPPALAQALVCAAVRETFEESGVLLAGPDADSVADVRDESFEADRQALVAHSLAFSELLRRRGLALRADLLRPWAHWITPEIEPRRFDTRFFVAAVPSGQQPRHVGGEAERSVWMRPAEALAEHTAGRLAMLPPTAFTLAEIAAFDAVADVLAAGYERDIAPVLPRVLVTGDTAELLLPGDDEYDRVPTTADGAAE